MTKARHGPLTQLLQALVEDGSVFTFQQADMTNGVGQRDAGLWVQITDQSSYLSQMDKSAVQRE